MEIKGKIPKTAQKFRHIVFASIGDTNMEGNVYWTHYFDWLALAREVFLVSIFPDFLKLFNEGKAVIITHETCIKNELPAFFADQIAVEISMADVKNTSAKMLVDFVRTSDNVKLAGGYQILVFADGQGKPAHIPPKLREAVLKYVSD